MTLRSNRPEGFVSRRPYTMLEILIDLRQGPLSNIYSHILTSYFLDTILVPLCTWLYLLALVILFAMGTRRSTRSNGFHPSKATEDAESDGLSENRTRRRNKTHMVLSILYFLLLLAQILMCVLEIVRLALAHLGIGLLPFTFVTLILAGTLRFTDGIMGEIHAWRWANLAVFIALVVTNGVKVSEETKEGTGQRKGSNYPGSDEIIDVSVMIGVYATLAILEVILRRGHLR